jgi:hypothetical protein
MVNVQLAAVWLENSPKIDREDDLTLNECRHPSHALTITHLGQFS